MKICTQCSEIKNDTEFYTYRGKPGSHCKECSKELCRQYTKTEQYHTCRIKRLFNVDYPKLVLEQNNRCKLCGTDIPGDKRKHFTVDHDHQTGKVRGLLCSKCNQGLGCFKDQKDLLVKAILYLDEGDNNGREEELDKRCYQEARCPNCASEEGW